MARVPDRRGVLPHPRRPERAAAPAREQVPGCGEVFFPRRLVCAQCLHEGSDDVELSTRGRLWTWTYCHVPLFGQKDADVPGLRRRARSTCPRDRGCSRSCSATADDFEIGMELEIDLETLRDEPRRRRGRDLPVPSRRHARRGSALMRRGLRFESVAVAGIGMVPFGMLHDYPMMHLARDAGLAALHDAGHDARRRRRGVRRLHRAHVDDRHQGHEGARAHRPAGHPHRERVGHRPGRVPRGGVGGVVGPGRRGDGAVLRQVHRHGARAAGGAAGAT